MIRKAKHLFFRFTDQIRELQLVFSLQMPAAVGGKKTIPVTLSMTSFPARIDHVWISIETLLRQTVKPDRFLLVLNTEDFPTKQLPKKIRKQQTRGLEIVWLDKNGRSFDKLIPTLLLHPNEPIITVDDDKFFPPNLLEVLWETHTKKPNYIVGARGWRIKRNQYGKVSFGVGWSRIEEESSGTDLHIPGGNGSLYPPSSLDPLVLDLDLALETCPTADDIWFWAAARKAKSSFICLGLPAYRSVSRLKKSPALASANQGREDSQFFAAIDVFSLGDDLERV